jgi:2-polyprenyl-3-methyl-5-hydroxy-6-metoxy-1,4-benzoquinol methylase
MKPMTQAPTEHYTKAYFEKWNYADRGLGRFSMYWFARRYYAALVRRFAPRQGGRLLEMGCGLGHLLGLLQDDFQCVGIDLIDYSIEQTRVNAPKAEAHLMDVSEIATRFKPGTFSAVVALHLVEHLPDPAQTIRDVNRLLEPGGLFLYATPQPDYTLRRFKDREADAIGKDKTHINVHPPAQWRQWSEESGFVLIRQFGDGLWDVPYLPVIPKSVQFAMFGAPALVQVLTQSMFTPLSMGVNQIAITRKVAEVDNR